MKKILFTMAVLSLASLSFSQDFGFGDDFGGSDYSSDFGSDSFDSAEPTVSISGEVGAKARAWGGTKNEDDEFDTRNYDSAYDFSKSKTEPSAHANLDFAYSGDFTDAVIKLKFNQNTIKDYPEDIIDEAYASGSFKDGRFQLKAGKIKEVWGKGDKVHVLDNFNANDYSDFIFPDYIDRRIGEIMFKTTANLSWDYNIKLEGIYAPMMTADRFASEKSMLYPYAQSKLTEMVKGILKAQGSALANNAVDFDGKTIDGDSLIGAIMDLSEFSTDKLYEDDIRTIKYSQAGARLTGTLGGIDWGASYYYGHYKQPSAKIENLIKMQYYSNVATKVPALATTASPLAAEILKKDIGEIVSLNYDQLQVFGLEAAFVLWKFNTRWEGAYNLTEDIAGDNPWIKNNSVSWLAGFDIDLPIHNLNLNVQETGTYILNNDKIEDNTVTVGYLAGKPIEVPIGTADVDYNSDGKYTKNKLIVLLSDKWLNEKLTTEVQGIYCFEDKGYMVAPKVEYNVSEGLTFGLRGVYLYCDNENGEFYNFTQNAKNHDKALVELTAKYQF